MGAGEEEPTEFLSSFLFHTLYLLQDTKKYYLSNARLYTEKKVDDSDDSEDSIAEYRDDVNAKLASFADQCLEAHAQWQKEILNRIKLVFGQNGTSNKEKLSKSDQRVSRTSWAMHPCTAEEKTSLLLRLLVLSIPEYGYDARMCNVLDQLWRAMSLERAAFVRDVECQLAEQVKGGCLFEQQDLQAQRTKSNRLKKGLMVGLGAVLGGVTVGVTAGLAAPAVIPFFASLMGLSASAAFLSGTTGAAVFGVLFGAGGAGLASYRVGRRYRNISTFYFHPVNQKSNHLHVALGVSGWITNDEDLYRPWLSLAHPGVDVFVLECEKEAFKELGSAIGEFIASSAVGYATLQILKTTALSTAVAALTWPIALLQSASLIDNPWSVCMNISQKAGLILADAIRNRAHGHRPLTLTGFSLGAVIIFECLKELSKDPTSNLGVIENVILFGLPAEIVPLERWSKMRMLVAGRFIHCYSKKDWVLRFLYRTTSLTIGDIAGLNPIEDVDGIENVNMSNFVKGHLEYAEKITEMLQLFNL